LRGTIEILRPQLHLIKHIVESNLFDSLIDQNEDTWFEAKKKNPYDFSTAAGHYELAKDVCGFANAEGGFILVGFENGS
jgi:predicted HTH transcriptional regulator